MAWHGRVSSDAQALLECSLALLVPKSQNDHPKLRSLSHCQEDGRQLSAVPGQSCCLPYSLVV